MFIRGMRRRAYGYRAPACRPGAGSGESCIGIPGFARKILHDHLPGCVRSVRAGPRDSE